MDLQEVLSNAVKAKRTEELKTSPQLTLGELILKLEAVTKKELNVYFDFECARPTHLNSWRGSYDELALSFMFEGDVLTVEKLLTILKGAVGKTYIGYKGGDYVMGKTTPVWVSNYGNSGNTAVVDVLVLDYSIILETKYCEFCS